MKSMRLSSIRTHAVSLPRRAVAPLRVRASSEPSAPVPGDSGNNNKTIALAGVGVGIALTVLSKVVGGGLGGGSVSIDTLVRESVPLETALKSGKPTIIEFYADWCEVCRESATNVYNVKQSVLNGKANLVMLNVENSAWAPEVRCILYSKIYTYTTMSKPIAPEKNSHFFCQLRTHM